MGWNQEREHEVDQARAVGTAGWVRRAAAAGTGLGLAAGLYNLAMVAAGLYLDMFWAFWVVMGLEAVALALLLPRLVASTRLLPNLGAGLLVFLAAAPLVALSTWIGWTLVAPDYAQVFAEATRTRMETAGRPAGEIEETMQKIAAAYRPEKQTWYALVGTALTGPVYALPLALLRWLHGAWRRRPRRAASLKASG